jgi:hypothetical protein
LNSLQLLLQYLTAPFRFLLKGPTYLIAAPRKVLGMKPPARAAALLAIFLVICTTIVVFEFIRREDVPHGEVLLNPKWIVALAAVLVATPAATYYLVRLWLEGDVSKYPEIDRAWDAGVEALAEQGIDLSDLPLYVILGVPNEVESAALMTAARIATVIAGVPKGPAPLRWYASAEAIYLICTGTGRLGRLSQLAAASAGDGSRRAGGGGAANPITATMVVGAAPARSPSPAAPSPTDSMHGGRSPILGTLVAGAPGSGEAARGEATPSSSGMSRKEADEESDRLTYIVRRLRRVRQPYCADNGVLTVLPHAVLSDVVFAKEVPDAVRADLSALRDAARLASPVTMLVTGMETEEGFTELVRRVGVDRARSSRFGKGFDVWNVASDENLDALSLHACGSFEDWVYTLFASDEGSEQRSNGKLFSMLCRVRRHLQPRLRGVLVNGYAIETEGNGGPPRLFSGCYFAATGRQGEQQAFVRSVFDKLDQLSEDLQWSDEALREESTYRGATWMLNGINAVLLLAILYFIYRCVVLITT